MGAVELDGEGEGERGSGMVGDGHLGQRVTVGVEGLVSTDLEGIALTRGAIDACGVKGDSGEVRLGGRAILRKAAEVRAGEQGLDRLFDLRGARAGVIAIPGGGVPGENEVDGDV